MKPAVLTPLELRPFVWGGDYLELVWDRLCSDGINTPHHRLSFVSRKEPTKQARTTAVGVLFW